MARSVALNNGAVMPSVGLGVFLVPPGAKAQAAVRSALELGYRHIDTAQLYNNEAEVGQAVRSSGLPREEVWVTSKIWPSEWGYERARKAIQGSLTALNLQYLDLMLLHAPGNPRLRAETWQACEDAYSEGLVKSIGVSNFGVRHLEKLAKTSRVTPAVNQIELHPFCQRRPLQEYCKTYSIFLQAYSPLAKGQKLADPTIVQVAKKLQVTPAQVMIRWCLQHDFVPLPKSVRRERQRSNLDVFSFAIPKPDMAILDGLEAGYVTAWDPATTDPV